MEEQGQQDKQSQQLHDLEGRVATLEEEIKRLKKLVRPIKNKTDADIMNDMLPGYMQI